MTPLVLALAVAAAAPASAAAPTSAAPPPAAAAAPGAVAEHTGPPAPDVFGFLWGEPTAERDGAALTASTGPGSVQLKISGDPLARREDELANARLMTDSLLGAVRAFYDAEGALPPEEIRSKLLALADDPLTEAEEAWLAAANHEKRRLFFVARALAAAADTGELPDVDRDLVVRRTRALDDGAVAAGIRQRADGYRSLARSIVAWLEGDRLGALQRMQTAAERLPDVAVAHALLGSFYLVFDQREPAVKAWRRANALDPRDAAVRDALREYDRKTR